MKILDRAKKLVGLDRAKRAGGVYISRPVLNGAEWAAWATKWGVPSPLGAADLHVTIISSATDVKMKPQTDPCVVDMRYACFCLMGPTNQALAVGFNDWMLQDRHWTLQSFGGVSDWPTYRPHMTITMANGDFELSDAALADAPGYIMLGAEVNADRKAADATPDEMDPEGVEDDDGDDALIIVIDLALSAKALLDSTAALTPIDRTALRDIEKGRKITVGVAKRLAAESWAPAEFKDVLKAGKVDQIENPVRVSQETRKRVERDVKLQMTETAVKAAAKVGLQEVMKSDDEQRILYAISNVYSIGGVTVEDLDGEGFTTRAMEEFTAQVLKRDTSGTWEHEGEPSNIVVQGLVLSHEVQKALGIDLGMECLITATHFPDPAAWERAKEGDWEQSIAGRFWYWEDEAED